MSETCWFCKGVLELRRIRHVREWGEDLFIFENVPAEVCTQCGERFFGPEALKKMDAIVTGPQTSARRQPVPVYSL